MVAKVKKMDLERYYNYLVDSNVVSDEALMLITNINGYNDDVLDDVLYYLTGYHNIKSYLYYEDKETFEEYYSLDDIEEII